MKNKLHLLIFLMIIFTPQAHAQETNYCHDPESWKEWDALVQKYSGNMDIQMLHAVRIGLCKKIEDGSISFSTGAAITLFNDMIDTVANKRGEADGQRDDQGEKKL
jgi:hypothetical protein